MTNDLDDTLAQLFFQDEPDTQSNAFTAAVRRRVARRRVLAKATRVVAVAALAAAAVALVVLVPEAIQYPVRELNRWLSSPFGAVACLLGTVGVAWWSRFGDA
ncbi:MAG TPA: hypothetical protein VE907_11450 [Gammaproteobacteria bacterium]|nr:hypothetical protein [Gammaproteobacteria bacterium]